ncbi:hypothetical protein Hlac_3427 (plasmid) [Halorubrum lacusprofundi ATCC 49239]|jgi:hypothetical protein|uniref:Uncharacterized protein n=1 Tax=Halorubrum lacusprofundi (strain ATCC 49239 / DSM 5036 / JCM 8891 / ACAM 34) TaxID=416348 RepID=B9LWU8_HALLT|nr:hypothetical protein [Halorubrum lacusprofundi]ACM58939.1 hypothetical protein Hlac_3427 [Halorubrum lacusprofundi ATCC 49239]
MVEPDIEDLAEETRKELEERDIDVSNPLEPSDEPLFDVGEFLIDNYQLFAVMGVFGAISIYLTTFRLNFQGVDENYINVGVVASLSIFLLVAIQILKRVYEDAEFSKLHFTDSTGYRHFELVLFSTSLILLTAVISYITLSLPRALTLLLSLLSAVAGWQFFGVIMDRIPTRDYTNGHPIQTFISTFLSYIFRLAVVSIVGSILLILFLAFIVVDYGSANIPLFLYEYIFVKGQGLLPLTLSFLIGFGIASTLSLFSIYSLYNDLKNLGD